MKKLRLHIAHLVTLLVAMQILNAGFFVQDFQQLSSSSTIALSDHNVINSIVEYVSEVVLDRVDSVPENNNKANKDLQGQKHFTVKLVEFKQQKIAAPVAEIVSDLTCLLRQDYSYRFFAEINPPPPKA